MKLLSSLVVLAVVTLDVLALPSYNPYRPQLDVPLNPRSVHPRAKISRGHHGRSSLPSHRTQGGLLPSIGDLTSLTSSLITSNPLLAPLVKHNGTEDVKRKGVKGSRYRPSSEELKKLKEKVAKDAKEKGVGPKHKVKGGKDGKGKPVANAKPSGGNVTTNAANPLSGVLATFVAPYGFVGYAAKELTSYFHTTTLTSDLAAAAIVTLPTATPSPDFELSIYDSAHPLLGIIEGYQGPQWGDGLPGYGTWTVVESSTYPASNTNNPTNLPSESNIFTLNPTTGEITTVWFNNDGTRVETVIFFDATYGDMNQTGDLDEYLEVYPDNCYVTSVYWVPLSYFGY